LYGKYGNNFAATMLRLMNDRGEVRIVDDQRGSPTWAFDLASLILLLISKVDNKKEIPYGIYHYTNEGNISWFDFAKEIYTQGKNMGLIHKDCSVKPCTSAEYPSRAKRPAYSVLDKNKIKTALGITIPVWDESLKEYLNQCAH
jgi:dTDP-4-dehydrorhamnose reductase